MAASTFDRFRKYTGPMMVVLCALLMFAFVVADPLMQMAQSRSAAATGGGDVVVSWDGGKLTERQLAELVFRRQVLASFQEQVFYSGARLAQAEGVVEPRPLVEPLPLPTTYEQEVEQSVVSTKIAADAARAAGMVVSDETVRGYLKDLGFRKVSYDEMRGILKRMGRGGLTIDYIFDLLRDELLARNYDRSYQYTSFTTMPQQRWRDWLRVNDRVVVEAAALRAKDFVSQVKEPTDDELKEFFEEYRDATPSRVLVGGVELPSPNPGFSSPRRVVLQYAKLGLDDEVQRLAETVTDEEIEKYYEDNKQVFIRTDFDDIEFGLEDDPGAGGDLEGEAADEEAAEETGEEVAEEEMAEDEAADESADDSAEPEAPVAEDAGEATEGAEPEPTDSGRKAARSPFRFVALQEESAEEEAAAADADEGVEEGAAADEKPLSAGDELFGESDMDDDEPATDADSADAGAAEAEEEKPIEYKPLDEVREEIRLRIAEDKVRSELQSRMADLTVTLQQTYDEYSIAVGDAEFDGSDPPPTPDVLKDLKGFAEANGLEFAETEPLNIFELSKSVIGRMADLSRTTRAGGPMPVYGAVFGESAVELYEPLLAYDVTFDNAGRAYPQSGYVVMKVVDEPRKKPDFEDAREEVLKAWKLREAAQIALEEAKKIAVESKEEGLSLKDFLAGRSSIQVVVTDEFSWLDAGAMNPNGGVRLRLSQPEPLESPGPDFMKEVFELSGSERGASLNYDETVAYAIRVVQHATSRPELRQQFLEMGDLMHRLYGFERGYAQRARAVRYLAVLGEDGLDWSRTPDKPIEADEEEEEGEE